MKKMFCALSLLLCAPLAQALPITYNLDFNVDFVESSSDPDVHVGNHYTGFFILDDALLAHDGINQAASVSDFFLRIEDTIWSLTMPSEFRGFRGPGGLGSASPGFDVLNGEITNLRGGVFGSMDVPFVDFSYLGVPGSFRTDNASGTFGGSMGVVRVPEPATLLLLAAGLLGVAGWRLRGVSSLPRLSSIRP